MSAKDENATKRNVPSRRNILLGGTTLAAASAFGAGVPVTIAQGAGAARAGWPQAEHPRHLR